MSDYFPGAIQIGGPIPRSLALRLAEEVSAAGTSLEWGGEPFAPRTAEDLLAAVSPEDGVLHLHDDSARYGHFDGLERWLEENGIAYDRQADARYEYDGEAVSFRPGLGTVTHFATQTGAPTIPRALLEPVRAQLREADTPEEVRPALQALEEAMGPDVPPLAFTD